MTVCYQDGYLDLITQAMPSASPSEVSTEHRGFGSGIGKMRDEALACHTSHVRCCHKHCISYSKELMDNIWHLVSEWWGARLRPEWRRWSSVLMDPDIRERNLILALKLSAELKLAKYFLWLKCQEKALFKWHWVSWFAGCKNRSLHFIQWWEWISLRDNLIV